MKFKSDIEVEAGIKDSSGAIGTAGQVLSSTGSNVSWVTNSMVAERVQHRVKAGVAINKGQAVYVTGADGTNVIVGKASNASEATSSKTLGLIDATVAVNGFANVVEIGGLAGLNTIGSTVGDPVWLGTDGNLIYGLVNKPYAPKHLVFIGVVTRVNSNNGEIFINVQNGFELNEIHDVDIKTDVPINGDILGYNGTLWVNKTIAEWLGYVPADDALVVHKAGQETITGIKTFTGSSTVFDYTGASRLVFKADGTDSAEFSFSPTFTQISSKATDGYLFKNSAGANSLTINNAGAGRFLSSLTATSIIKSGGTSSQFLKADGSVDSTVYVPTTRTITINGVSQDLSENRSWTVSGGVSGSGAVGQVAYWDGTTSITGENNLFWDSTNDRLGIGSANPNYKLEINAGALGSTQYSYLPAQMIYSTNTNGEYFEMGSLRTSAGSDWTFSGFRLQERIDSTWMGYMQFNGDSNNGGISFGTGTSSASRQAIAERMRITPSGNVGIGITPTTRLQVAGGELSNWVTSINSTLASGHNLYFGYNNNTDTTYGLLINGGRGLANQVDLGVANKFYVNGNGNVLINTTTDAGYKFDVNGTGRFQGSLQASTLKINTATDRGKVNIETSLPWGTKTNDVLNFTSYGYAGDINTEHNAGSIKWWSADQQSAAITAWRNTPAAGDLFDLAFSTNPGGNNLTERMRITSAGNVGIYNTLYAINNVRSDGAFGGVDFTNTGFGYQYSTKFYTMKSSSEIYGFTNDYGVGTSAELSMVANAAGTGNIAFYTDTVARLRIKATGNVLIGTNTDSGHKLDVNGVIRGIMPSDPTTGAVTAKFLSYAANPFGLIFRGYATGAHSIQSQRETSNSELYPLLLQPLGGNVGIGPNIPTSALQIDRSTWAVTGATVSRMLQKEVGSASDYQQHVILLHPVYSNTLLSFNKCAGTIYATRGGAGQGLISDTYNVDTSSAYNGYTGTINSQWGYGRLYTCNYNGIKYMALMPEYRTSAVEYDFDGYIRSTGEQLKIVVYRISNTGVIVNSEVNNSLAVYNPGNSFYQGNLHTAADLYAGASACIGTSGAGPTTRLTLGGYSGNRLPYINNTTYSFDTGGITVGSSTTNSSNKAGGLDLTNNTYSVGAYSPIISFSSLTSNSTYNNSYAGIWGIMTGQGGDANWLRGGLSFGTAGGYGIQERMHITADGNVGIDVNNPADKFQVRGSIAKATNNGIDGVFDNVIKYGYFGDLNSGNTNANRWLGIDATVTAGAAITNALRIRAYGGGTGNAAPVNVVDFRGDLSTLFYGNVTAVGFFNSSDIKLKELTPYEYNVSDIKPITYFWKDLRDNKKHIGYSAQEVQKVMPDAVNEGEDGMLSVNYIEVLVAKIAELENRIKQLEK
jgi:hypothetical protein